MPAMGLYSVGKLARNLIGRLQAHWREILLKGYSSTSILARSLLI